jgi:predicted peptidase
MRARTLLAILLLAVPLTVRAAQTARVFEQRSTRTLAARYLLHVPEGAKKPLPVIVYLHGGSLRGEDVEKLRTLGVPGRAEQDPRFPFIVIAPLLPAGEIWTNDDTIIALLDHVLRTQPADRNRVYLTGHSMGGRGALYVAYKHPDRFAAVVAMSAVSPIAHWGTKLRGVPLWYFHGVKDAQAPVADADALMDAIKTAGGDVRYTRLDDRDHFILDMYDRDDLYAWLLQHSKAAQ